MPHVAAAATLLMPWCSGRCKAVEALRFADGTDVRLIATCHVHTSKLVPNTPCPVQNKWEANREVG